MMCSDTIHDYETDEFYHAGNAQPTTTQQYLLPDLLHPDTTPGTPLIWHRPTNCPALQRFPHYSVAHPTPNTYHLKGIHFRYEPYKDRAKLWLPLNNETIPGATLQRYQPITQTIHDPTTNRILTVVPHNLCQSRHPWRGYIRLGYNATQYFKDIYNIHETRLVNNPHITVILTPSNYKQPTGPPNKWKPEFLNKVYEQGLLKETARVLGYEIITYADIHFEGGGSISRPDVIAKMRKIASNEIAMVIIEGKACLNRKAPYFVIEAVIQVLHKKVVLHEYRAIQDAVVTITGDVKKPKWKEIVGWIQNADELPYSKRIKRCAKEIWKNLRKREEYWEQWYHDHLYFHDISELLRLANNRPESTRKEILHRLKLISWR